MEIPTKKRKRKKRKMPSEDTEDSYLHLKETTKRVFYEVLDQLTAEVSTRFTMLKKQNNIFGRFALIFKSGKENALKDNVKLDG